MAQRSSAAAVIAMLMVSAQGGAQEFPVKPIRVLTGGAGNAVDLSARYLGQRLSEKWGKSVVIENRGGLAHLAAYCGFVPHYKLICIFHLQLFVHQ